MELRVKNTRTGQLVQSDVPVKLRTTWAVGMCELSDATDHENQRERELSSNLFNLRSG